MADETQSEREQRLRTAFFEALDDSPFVMLGLKGVDDDRTRPMTAQIDAGDDGKAKDGGKIYFFGSKSEPLGRGIASSSRAIATYASKDHKVFAHIHGTLAADNDQAVIDRLWNPIVASWYKDGKNDPDLLLIRFDAEHADVWEAHTGSTLKAALVKMMGRDPGKDEQKKNQAEVAL